MGHWFKEFIKHSSRKVKLFSKSQIPWEDIAFSAVTFALENYITDSKNGISGKCHSNY